MDSDPAANPTNGPRPADLVIRHGHVLTMADDFLDLPDGAVAIRGRRIVGVGPDAEIAARFRATRTIDAHGGPVHPGLVDAHVHASYHLFRGAVPDHIGEDDVFAAIERPFYETVSDEEEHLAVVLASLEMIRAGTTAFLEAGTILTPAAGAEAAERVGIRAVIGDARVMDRPSAERRISRSPRDLDEALARLGGELRRNADPDALVTGQCSIHGFGTASDALLLEAKRRADAAGAVVNLHHAYSAHDVAADRDRYGTDPLRHFADIGFLGRNVTLAHANFLTDAEADLLLASGASVAWAPAASMLWGHGATIRGRHAELWHRGASIALASDSGNWANRFDVLRQAAFAALVTREAHRDRTALVAEDVLWMATRGGARAAGLGDRVGALEPGRRADVVIHDAHRPELAPPTDVARNLVYAAGSATVRTVIVDGAVILEDGAFPQLDEAAIVAHAGEASAGLLRRMGITVERNRFPGRRGPAGA